MKKTLILSIAILTLTSCVEEIKQTIKSNNEVGKTDIRYYADKTVSSLEVPPDLTKPRINDNLDLSNLINTDNKLTNFDATNTAIKKINNKNINIEVKKNSYQSYLLVDKNVDYVFNAVKSFLKDTGFNIEKENKAIGVLETNFLENKVIIPKKNLNVIRSVLQTSLGQSYALPTIDKYRVRIENVGSNQSEIYLSINSMQEVVTNKGLSDENTIWQPKPRDEFIETEMLYRLMIYMGSSSEDAKKQITTTMNDGIKAELKTDINGFAKLQFNFGKEKVWNIMAFVIDSLNINIEDRDKRDGSFYIKVANEEEKGVLSAIFGDEVIKQSFRIKIKQLESNFSEVYFIDLTGENSAKTKRFSKTLFTKIKNKI